MAAGRGRGEKGHYYYCMGGKLVVKDVSIVAYLIGANIGENSYMDYLSNLVLRNTNIEIEIQNVVMPGIPAATLVYT